MWELAHRTAEADEATMVLIEADTSPAAIEQVRTQIPTDLICGVLLGVA